MKRSKEWFKVGKMICMRNYHCGCGKCNTDSFIIANEMQADLLYLSQNFNFRYING